MKRDREIARYEAKKKTKEGKKAKDNERYARRSSDAGKKIATPQKNQGSPPIREGNCVTPEANICIG